MCGRTQADGFKVGLASCTNAIMRVTAFRNGRRIKEWTGEVRWTGTIPDDGVYTGTVERGRVTWNGAAPEGLRVETDRRGNGGIPLRRWLPRTADRVEVRVDPGYGAGRGVGRSQRRGGAGEGEGAERGDRGAASSSTRSPAGTGRGTAGRGDGGAGSGDPCGLRGGGASGQRGGASAEDGGVPDAWSSTPWGEAYGDAEGAAGGDGARGEHGIRGALALLAIIEISRELRAALELVVIAADVTHPEEFVKRAAARIGRMGARRSAAQVAAAVRVELASEARRFAHAEVVRVRPVVEAAMRGKSRAEIKRALRVVRDHRRVKYFELVEAGALGNAPEIQIVRRAARVKPVAGRLPRNHQYAGETFVVDARASPDAARIVRERRRKGVKFTDEGYPVFDPWVYKQGRVKADVRIKNTRKGDE